MRTAASFCASAELSPPAGAAALGEAVTTSFVAGGGSTAPPSAAALRDAASASRNAAFSSRSVRSSSPTGEAARSSGTRPVIHLSAAWEVRGREGHAKHAYREVAARARDLSSLRAHLVFREGGAQLLRGLHAVAVARLARLKAGDRTLRELFALGEFGAEVGHEDGRLRSREEREVRVLLLLHTALLAQALGLRPHVRRWHGLFRPGRGTPTRAPGSRQEDIAHWCAGSGLQGLLDLRA